jgi:hypothetical protein
MNIINTARLVHPSILDFLAIILIRQIIFFHQFYDRFIEGSVPIYLAMSWRDESRTQRLVRRPLLALRH